MNLCHINQVSLKPTKMLYLYKIIEIEYLIEIINISREKKLFGLDMLILFFY